MAILMEKCLQQFVHYFAGNVLTLLLGLVTFPLLTRLLSKEQYGIMGLITTTMMLMVAIGKAGLSDGIVRYYRESVTCIEDEELFNSTVISRGVSQATIVVIIYGIGILIFYKIWGMASEQVLCFMIMGVSLFVRPLSIIVLNIMRVKGKTIFINVIGVMNRVLSALLSLELLLYFMPNLSAYFVGVVAADLIVVVILLAWLFVNFDISWKKRSPELRANLLKFGWPLLVSELAYLLISYADRYMIAAYWGSNAVGEYAAGYNLANYISGAITFALSYAIIPTYVEIFTATGREKTEDFLQKSMGYLLMVIIPICCGYYAVAGDLFLILTSGKYMSAATFSPLILIGTFALGINNILYAGLYLQKKSLTILAISLGAVVLNILLNMVLLPSLGIVGSAIATLITCFAMNLLTVWLSFRYIYIRLDYWLIVRYLAISFCMVLLIKLQPTTGIPELLGKIVTGVVMMGGTVLIFEKEISRAFFQWCRQ